MRGTAAGFFIMLVSRLLGRGFGLGFLGRLGLTVLLFGLFRLFFLLRLGFRLLGGLRPLSLGLAAPAAGTVLLRLLAILGFPNFCGNFFFFLYHSLGAVAEADGLQQELFFLRLLADTLAGAGDGSQIRRDGGIVLLRLAAAICIRDRLRLFIVT